MLLMDTQREGGALFKKKKELAMCFLSSAIITWLPAEYKSRLITLTLF
jgi:hypothetical protein